MKNNASMQAKFLETKSEVAQIIGNNFKIISQNKEHNYVLVELEDGTRIVVNLTTKKFYSTRTLDSGIQFESTGHVIGKELNLEDLTKLYQPKYTKHGLTLRIMDILQLNSEVGWSVVDSYKNLHLIHYNDDADMSLVGHLRGVVVDVTHGLIVCSSFGYTPTICTNELVVNHEGNIVLHDNNNITHTFGKETMIKRCYDGGVVLRVIYYAVDGEEAQTFRITHKKIRPMKSRFGNSIFFTQMYKDAGGPLDSQLFDLTKKYSPMCYVFLVVHPKLLMATRQNVLKPYVVLLSINQLWVPSNGPFLLEEVELECQYSFEMSPYISGEMNQAFVHFPEALSLEAANKHLLYGYYDEAPNVDIRQLPSESLIIYKFFEGKVIDIVKVNSVAYDYRFGIRNNDPAIYHQFYNLVNHSYTSLNYYTNYVEFKQKFMLFEHYTKEDLIEMINKDGKILYLNHGDIVDRKDRASILEMIWLNYVLCLPFNMQLEACSFLEKFNVEREQVTRWLQAYESSHPHLDKNDISDRGVGLITSARTTATSLINTKKATKYDDTIRLVIANFIKKEFGTSLYALVKKMKNVKEQ